MLLVGDLQSRNNTTRLVRFRPVRFPLQVTWRTGLFYCTEVEPMAGDWMPMRLDLYEDPSVIQIATALGEREEVVVGYLHKLWSWASRQLCDGYVTGVTLESLGRVTNLQGFPEMVRDAGWLIEEKDGIRFPNWDNWMSESAKTRLQAAQRQRKKRQKRNEPPVTQVSRNERDKNVTTEEKSTEEKSTGKKESKRDVDLSGFPENLASAIQGWIVYKTERREGYKPQGMKALLTQIAKAEQAHGAAAVIDSIEQAQANGWKGWAHGLSSNGAPKQQQRHKKVVYIPKDER